MTMFETTLDVETWFAARREALRQKLPGWRDRLEEFATRLLMRESLDPETVIKERFDSIQAATFSPRRFGLIIVAAFFGFGGLWAAFAPLSSAAIAPGVVSPKSSRQTVQHLEGGIIREIRVKEGDSVKAGDTLMVLDDVSARTDVEMLQSRSWNYGALESRLTAERDQKADIAFSPGLMKNLSDPEVRAIMDAQVNQFATRRKNDESHRSILRQQIAQLNEQISGLEEQLASAVNQSNLIDEEAAGVAELVEKGLERRPRLLALQRSQAELLGQQGDLKARIAQAREAIGGAELEVMKIDIDRREDVEAQLADTQAKKAEIDQQLHERMDRLSRTTIIAPVAGKVLDIRFKTAGGVVKPGEAVADIVPTDDTLVIDARVSIKDIDVVRAGLKASVVFPAYRQRTLPRLEARVTSVSADTLTDERTGERYYTARVEVDRDKIHHIAPIIELQPGMASEVFIATGNRTMLAYLFGPFLDTLRRSFREN